MENTHNHSAENIEKQGLFYTYFGDRGSAIVAFLYFLFLVICIFSFVKWG